jgi:hypothetical protein
MRAGFIVSGVLGIGTVLVFAAAALVSTMFPNGATVAAGWNGNMGWGKGGMAVPMPVPAPGVVVDGGFIVNDGGGFTDANGVPVDRNGVPLK